MYSVKLYVHVSCSRNTALFVCPWSAALLLPGGTCWVRYWTIVAFMSKRLKCGDMLCRALDSLRGNVVSRSTSCSCSLTIASDGTHLHNAGVFQHKFTLHWQLWYRDHTANSIKLISNYSNLEGLHFSRCQPQYPRALVNMAMAQLKCWGSQISQSSSSIAAAFHAPWLRRFLPGCLCQSGAGAEGLTCVGHRGDLGSTGEGLDPVGKFKDWGKFWKVWFQIIICRSNMIQHDPTSVVPDMTWLVQRRVVYRLQLDQDQTQILSGIWLSTKLLDHGDLFSNGFQVPAVKQQRHVSFLKTLEALAQNKCLGSSGWFSKLKKLDQTISNLNIWIHLQVI